MCVGGGKLGKDNKVILSYALQYMLQIHMSSGRGKPVFLTVFLLCFPQHMGVNPADLQY